MFEMIAHGALAKDIVWCMGSWWAEANAVVWKNAFFKSCVHLLGRISFIALVYKFIFLQFYLSNFIKLIKLQHFLFDRIVIYFK